MEVEQRYVIKFCVQEGAPQDICPLDISSSSSDHILLTSNNTRNHGITLWRNLFVIRFCILSERPFSSGKLRTLTGLLFNMPELWEFSCRKMADGDGGNPPDRASQSAEGEMPKLIW
jgi:hypothetical protein